MAESTTPTPATKRRRSVWPYALTAMFCVHASIVFITMTFASKTPANAEPDYYEKAIAWNDASESRLTVRREGWSVQAASEDRTVTVRLADRSDAPIGGASVVAVSLHRASPLDRTVLEFEEGTGGRYTAQLPSDRAGLWDLRLSITTADGKHALIAETVELKP